MQPKRTGHIIRKILKVLAWIVVSIISLFLLVLILIQLPAVQNYGKKKIVSFLEKKIGTPVQIAHLDIDFPKLIVLEDVYFQDQQKDTLLAGKKLRVDISLFKLFKNKVEINEISLEGITAHVNRNAAGVFNFDYIINAFASEPKVEDTTSTPMQFSLDEINLDKIDIKYHDDFMGYDMALRLTHFDTDIQTFDLENSRYKTDDITLEGLTTTLRQFKPLGEKIAQIDSTLTPDTNHAAAPIDLSLGDIKFSSVKINYQNEIDSIFTKLNLGRLFVSPGKIDINGEKVTVNELALQNTSIDIYLGRKPAAQQVARTVSKAADSVGTIIQQQGWIIDVKKLSLKNDHLVYDDVSSPKLPVGIDYSHLDVQKLHFDAESLHYQPDSIRGTINDFSFNEKSGVELNEMETDFLYTNTQAYLKDLYLETPNTKIQRSIALHYPSIEALTKNIGALQLDADLRGSVIGLKDIAYFVPALTTQPLFHQFPDAKLRADLVLKGSVNNLVIPELELNGLKNTHVKLSGRIINATDTKHLYTDLDITNISTTDIDIYSLVPKGSLPDNIRIPSTVTLQGSIKGNMQKLQTDLGLRSSFGNAKIKATISDPADSIRAVYTANISLDRFYAGRLLKQEAQLGAVSLNVNVKGSGYTASRMNVIASGIVNSAEVKNYTYKNLRFNATGSKGLYEATAAINDPNIDLNLEASADLNGAKPAVKGTVMIDSIALKPLHFSSTDVRVHSKITADIPNLDVDDLVGKVMVSELLVNTGTHRFVSDTIIVDAVRTDTGNAITVTSPMLVAGLSGKYTLTGIGASAQQIVNRYYPIGTVAATNIPPQQASFYAKVYNSDFLKEIMPQLNLSDSIIFSGKLNSITNTIALNGDIPALNYGTNQISKATIALNTTDSAIFYAINLDQFKGTSFKIANAKATGKVANNTITYNVQVKDDNKKEKYFIAGSMSQQDGSYQFKLATNGLKIDYDDWTVNPKNSIEFGKNGIRATDFEISNGEQHLSIQSETPTLNAPLNMRFTDFKIESITKIAEKDSLYLGGLVNGTATVTNLNASPLFEANLTVNNFNYKKDTLGDIVIKANNRTPDSYTANISITGNGNSIMVNGNYYTSGNIDFDVDLEKVNLASIESFTQGNVKRMTGAIDGRLKVTGTATAPKVIGDVNFKDASMNVTMLNALFRMDDQRISFKDDGVHFDNFTIRDSLNNTAVINGAVYTTDYSKYRFNIDFDADDFQVINSTKKDNPLYYGKLFIDTKIKVRGDMDKPEVNADITVNDKTSLTIVLPQTDAQVAARDGIVEFFDQDNPQLDSMLLAQYDTLNHSNIKGLDVVANVEIDKEAEFSLVIDEANGDFVRIKGEGSLSGGIDPSGKTSLTGTYEMTEGSYEMSFNFLRRKFTIQDGSTLTWTGEPTSANMNVTAIYVADAAPIDLVEQQLQDASATIRNTYKQKLPFNVLLTMKGELLKPELSFDIVLPEKNYTVSTDIVEASNTRLAQIRQEPAELNKQVFALLLLNRFVSENPFESSGGSTSATTLAKQSVSKLLAEQLNKLAADLIAGVDINFGLETTQDYTTGQQKDRTDLNVGVSKQLLNDRLKVSVGSNFELEGPTQSNQKTSNIAGNIQVDYKLTKDGGLLLRGYRLDQYEVALQGQVVETGITFIISVDYDKFREIIERRKEKKMLKKEVKQERKELQLDSKEEDYQKD